MKERGVYNDPDNGAVFYYRGIFKLSIIGYSGPGGKVKIPKEINRKPVIAIGKDAFSGKNLSTISIPNSIVSIGDRAFAHNKLNGVSIPDNVTLIGRFSFADNKLTGISLPNTVTIIENGVFKGHHLSCVIIPDSVLSIRNESFWCAYSSDQDLTSITIGANVKFEGCPFGNGFEYSYDDNGKAAGTYTRPDTDIISKRWVKVK
jgi:hypothetical protein